MCGICGKISWINPIDQTIVRKMNDALTHRGPDAGGVVALDQACLGHRRLAIIDLSPAGGQPMTDGTGNYWIVFNGEIYNFLELRQELQDRGITFRSRSDTEVILEAYKAWGVDFLQRLNGMFAFALWDIPRRRLMLARDRLGKKPLFYTCLGDNDLTFASELKALLQDPTLPKRLNVRAMSQYLSMNYILSGESILEGVHKLPPASYLLLEEGKDPQTIRYWNLAQFYATKSRWHSEGEAAEALGALLDDAVRMRLISDVPLGVFLSGGVDSSTILASMCQMHPPESVKSFSIGFPEKTFSEVEEARQVAGLFGANHHERLVSADAGELLPKIVHFGDEPFADTSIIPTYLLAQFSRQTVTVCLSGDGGDEVFAGYETYAADKIHRLTSWIPQGLAGAASAAADRWLPVHFDKVSWDYKLRHFLMGHALSPPQAHYSWRLIFSDREKAQLLQPDMRQEFLQTDPYQSFRTFFTEVAGCHYLDQAMYVDIKTWLVDDILVKVDRATMAHSLEARAPLLDHRIVEFAAALPVDLKMKGFNKKYLLKRSQSGRIPLSILNRKKKGFNAPINHWLNGIFKDQFKEITLTPPAIVDGWFDTDFILSLWERHERKEEDNSHKLMGLIILFLWLQAFQKY